MDPHLVDLIDALPGEIKESARTRLRTSLQGLLENLGQRPVPVGRLNRGWIFGAVQAKIAAAYLAHWIRAGFSGAGESERQLNETRLKAALELLGGTGYLRGAMMKLGQVFANYPDVAPEEFASVLGYFHFEAPPMHFSLLREFVRDELGADPEDRFDDFETEAFAAASASWTSAVAVISPTTITRIPAWLKRPSGPLRKLCGRASRASMLARCSGGSPRSSRTC